MNGVHDMGGQHGMGLVQYEKNEPVFHAPWEGRVYALNRALRAWRKWSLDTDRHAIELLPPADYLQMSYYERWLTRLLAQVVTYGLVTKEEMEAEGRLWAPRRPRRLQCGNLSRWLSRGIASSKIEGSAMFKGGQRVRARNINPTSHHTRFRGTHEAKSASSRETTVKSFPTPTLISRGETPATYTPSVSGTRAGGRALHRATRFNSTWDDYLERT